MTTQSQSPAVVKFNMFHKRLSFESKDCTKELKLSSVLVFWARLLSFGQLGLISEPQISSKLQNGINDPKGLENKIYSMMKGRGHFTVTTRSHLPAAVKFNMFYKRLSFGSMDKTKRLSFKGRDKTEELKTETVECTCFLDQTSYFRLIRPLHRATSLLD